MNGRRLMVLLLAVLALVAAGCGGDDSSEASGDTDSTTVVETSADETMEETDDATESTSDDDVGALGGKCAELAGISTKFAQSLSGQAGDLDDAARLFDEIADEVPDEIKADYEVIAENFGKIAEALKDADLQSGETPSPEVIAKLQQVTSSLDSAEVKEASANIEAWAQKNC